MKTDTALLIFDPHQDADWIRRILKLEEGNFTHLLLGGDYFDAKSDRAGSLAEMCELLHELDRDYGSRLTLLWGNHDIQYLEAIPSLRRHRNPRHQNYKIPGDYSNSKAKKLSKLLDEEFLKRGRLLAKINGHLISHAGIAGKFWPEADSLEESIQLFEDQCDKALLTLPYQNHGLLQAGEIRGGDQAIGGITWLDFNHEFSDDLELPQIFGHTTGLYEDITSRARQEGRSWCLDGAQTIYGLLRKSGELEIQTA